MRTLCLPALLTAAVVAACTSTQESATAPRRFTPRFSTVVDSDTAVLATADSQPIKGWGLYPGGGNNPFFKAPGPQAEGLLYSMGLTFIRDQLDPALYDTGTTVSDIALNSAQVNAYVSKWTVAKDSGMGYILSVWSPPDTMKDGALNGGQLDSATGRAEFVAFLTVVMQHLNTSTAGLPKALSIQNEPDFKTTSYPSTPYDTALWELTIDNTRGSLNFAGFQSVTTFGPELSKFDSAQMFLGGASFTSIDGGYFADSSIGAYAFHTYGDNNWSSLRTFIETHHKDVWVTEFSKPNAQGTSQVARAIDLMGALGANLEIIPTNYWAWWNGFAYATTDPAGGTLILGDTIHNTLQVTSMFYTLRKLFKAVVPGAWNLQVITSYSDKSTQLLRYTTTGQESSSQPRIDFYGFEKANTDSTVVVVSNWTNDDKRITVVGFPTKYKVQHGYVSDSASTNAEMIVQDSSTVWTPSGQTVGRTVLYAPARSVLIAVMN